jgi:hypothetical protein
MIISFIFYPPPGPLPSGKEGERIVQSSLLHVVSLKFFSLNDDTLSLMNRNEYDLLPNIVSNLPPPCSQGGGQGVGNKRLQMANGK